jgi:hypothetical protein
MGMNSLGNLEPAEKQESQQDCNDSGLSWFQIAVVLAIGIIFCYGVNKYWGFLNGIEQLTNWQWKWHDQAIWTTVGQTAGPFLIIAWVLWAIRKKETRRDVWLILSFLAVSNFLLQVAGKLTDPEGLKVVQSIVLSGSATGYFEDATYIGKNPGLWLRHFYQTTLSGHSWTHPPGPILFYYLFLRVFNPANAALIGGLAIGLLGSIGVAVMYFFSALWTQDQTERLTAGCLYALLPALIVFLPEFDQIYPAISMLLILLWVRALQHAKSFSAYGWAGGFVLFIAIFFAYNLLLIGIFLLYYALYWLWTQNWSRAAFRKCLVSSGAFSGVCIGVYAALWLVTGYNPITSFLRSYRIQSLLAAALHRDYHIFIVSDIYDFLLGAGVIAAPILFFHMRRLWKRFEFKSPELALSAIGIATIGTVDLTGLLRGETTRVWLFLQPLLIAPMALALSRTGLIGRFSVFILQWFIVACLLAKMLFVVP